MEKFSVNTIYKHTCTASLRVHDTARTYGWSLRHILRSSASRPCAKPAMRSCTHMSINHVMIGGAEIEADTCMSGDIAVISMIIYKSCFVLRFSAFNLFCAQISTRDVLFHGPYQVSDDGNKHVTSQYGLGATTRATCSTSPAKTYK